MVEIDGAVHDDPDVAAYGRERATVLRCRELRLVRIKNEDVSHGFIEAAIRRALAESPPLPKGEGAGG